MLHTILELNVFGRCLLLLEFIRSTEMWQQWSKTQTWCIQAIFDHVVLLCCQQAWLYSRRSATLSAIYQWYTCNVQTSHFQEICNPFWSAMLIFNVCKTLRVVKKRLNAPFGFIFHVKSEPLDFSSHKGGAFKRRGPAAPELGCGFYAFTLSGKMDASG